MLKRYLYQLWASILPVYNANNLILNNGMGFYFNKKCFNDMGYKYAEVVSTLVGYIFIDEQTDPTPVTIFTCSCDKIVAAR